MIRRALRGLIALLLATLTGVGIVTAGAVPAAAGGPTAVMLVEPDLQKAAGLFASDPRYHQLAASLGMSIGSGFDVAEGAKGAPDLHASGPMITLTWLIHGVRVWRIDRIYLGAAGGPWIATQTISGDGDLYDQATLWHHIAAPGPLRGLLAGLGLLDPDDAASAAPQADADTPAPAAAPAAAPAGAPAADAESPATTASGTAALSGWRWSIPGFAVGALAVLAAISLTPLWRNRDRTPRWELVDERD